MFPKVRMAILGWIACLLVTLSSNVHAANLAGVVVDDEDNAPLAFCVVAITSTDTGNVDQSVLTRTDGGFTVTDLPPGRYELKFSYIGYDSLTLPIALTGQDEPLVVRMVVKAIEMEEQVVFGDRDQVEEEVQAGFVKLTSDDLASIPAIGEADPIRALQLLPGVQAASDISSGLYVRGGGPDQNLVLLDQVPIYNPTHAFGLFSTFNPAMVDQVTLFKGAYPAEYGGRLGSVLDVRSRGNTANEVSGRVGISTIAARAQVEGPLAGGTWSLGGRRTYLDPILNALRRNNSEIPSYYFYDGNAKYTLPRGNNKFEFWLYRSNDVLRVEPDPDTFLNLTWGNTIASSAWTRVIGERVVANVVGSWSRYRSDSDFQVLTTPISIENELNDVSGQASLSVALPPHHRLKLGVAASTYRFEFLQSFNRDVDVDFDRRPKEYSVYAEDLWRPRPETTLRLGARARFLDDGNRRLVEPRLSLRQKINDQWQVKAAGGLYYQYLQLVSTEGFAAADFYLPIDDTTDPSRSVQSVLGLEWDAGGTWSAAVEGYYTDLQSLVLFDTEAPVDESQVDATTIFLTGGTGYATGAEVFIQKKKGRVTGWLGYTLGWTRRTFAEVNEGNEFAPKYDRRHDFKAVMSVSRGAWDFGFNFVYGTGQAFTPASAIFGLRDPATGLVPEFGEYLPAARNSARLLPYHRLDFSARREFSLFGLPARWQFQLFNAYSNRNDWFVQYNINDPGQLPDVVKQLPLIPSLGVEFEF